LTAEDLLVALVDESVGDGACRRDMSGWKSKGKKLDGLVIVVGTGGWETG
jgi:hypothetical protein